MDLEDVDFSRRITSYNVCYTKLLRHVFGLSTAMNFAIYMAWTNILVPKPQAEQLLEAITKFRNNFV